MTKQFRVTNTRPSNDGKTITASVVDPDYDRFTREQFPPGVTEIGDDEHGNPVVRFPAEMLVGGNVLDLGRATRPITIRIPYNLHARAKRFAFETNISIAELCRRGLEEQLDRHQPPEKENDAH